MSPLRRSLPLRPLKTPTTTLPRLTRPQQQLRSYADNTTHARSAPLKNNLPLFVSPPSIAYPLRPPTPQLTHLRITVGTVFALVPFYYFFQSDRSPNSEKQAIAEGRDQAKKEGGGPGKEYRDVRDSPVKTLEDKRRKEEGREVGR